MVNEIKSEENDDDAYKTKPNEFNYQLDIRNDVNVFRFAQFKSMELHPMQFHQLTLPIFRYFIHQSTYFWLTYYD